MVDLALLHAKYLQAKSVSIDSRCVEPGALFFAIRGNRFNGNCFAQEALNRGASCAIVDDQRYMLADLSLIHI